MRDAGRVGRALHVLPRERETKFEPGPPRPGKPFGYLPWLLAAAVVAVIAAAVHLRTDLATRVGRVSPGAFPTVQVRPGELAQTIRLTGTTAPATSAFLRAPYLRGRRSIRSGDFGLVLQQLAEPGSRVRKGDVVASFDLLSMQTRLDDERADRIEKELRLKTMEQDLAVTRAAYDQRVRSAKARMGQAALDLKTAPVRSAIQVALYQLAFEEGKAVHESLLAQKPYVEASERADMRRAELDLRESQVEERRAEVNLGKMVVRAPVDGLVVVSEVFRGSEFSRLRAGDQLRPGQVFLQIVDPSSIVIEASVNQSDVEDMRIGARARVLVDAYRDLELPARVYSIGPLSRSRGWRTNYVSEVPVFLRLDRADLRLIPNLTVSADIVLHSQQAEEIVPRDAVFHDAESGNDFAYVRTPEGWEKREIKLGLANHIEVAVRSGLAAGETIAVSAPPA